MNQAALAAFSSTDWSTLGPAVLLFADETIAQYRWRGVRIQRSPGVEVTIEGMGAAEFVAFAIDKLGRGIRTYREDLSVEQNLRRTIESDIFNFHKKAQRFPLIERTLEHVLAGGKDPVEEVPEEGLQPNPAQFNETLTRQRELLARFVTSLAGDDELTLLLFAYEEGKYKPAEVEAATGIDAKRVSELKRKLKSRAETFLNSLPEYSDLHPMEQTS